MRELRDRVAVVIGGGSGIGRGIALALAEQGTHVCVADLEEDAARAVAAEVAERGVRGLAARVDVTDRASLEALARRARAELGPVHVLSNNAGVVCLESLAEAREQDWLWVMSVNLHGVVNGVAAFLPHLREHGDEAHIQNTASMAGLLSEAWPGLGLYTASKHACVAYSEVLRSELAPHGIGVSVLCPGMIRSNLAQTSARNRPARFGGPLPEPQIDREAAQSRQMPAEVCGRITVRGIQQNRLYILTHPKTRAAVERRFARILEDYDAAEKDPEAP